MDFIISGATAEGVYRNETPNAQECVLSWCIKSIKSSYYWASYEEEVTDTFINTTTGSYPWSSIIWPGNDPNETVTEISYLENITIQAPADENALEFGLSNNTMMRIVGALDEVLPSFTTTANISADTLVRYRLYKTHPGLHSTDYIPWTSQNDVAHYVDRLATAITNHIRSDQSSNEYLVGSAFGRETYVSVRWGWLAFPLVLLLISVGFLAATIYRTSKQKGEIGVWKTSAMPTLIYGLPKEAQGSFNSQSSALNKKTRIRLLLDKGWRVSGHVSAPTTPVARRHGAPPGWI